MHGEPGLQLEAALGGEPAQAVEGRPRPLGVDVVRRQRRDPAPVVDARLEQGPALGQVDQVGRRLHPRLRAEHQPGDRDRGAVLVEVEVVGVPHRGVGLGAEVLHDHFLHRGVAAGGLAEREDRLGPLGQGLPDADQQSGGERDGEPAGVLQHPQPHLRVLVRRSVVRLALRLVEPPRRGLQHHPHRGGDGLESVQLLPRHHAGIQVRQQPGLLQHPHRHRADVGQRGVVALLVEPRPGLGPAVLRPVAEREQRLQAAQLRALAGDVEDLVGGEVRRAAVPLRLTRGLHERAVVAAVPAQPGHRDEHLRGVGHDARPSGRDQPGVADLRGCRGEPVQLRAGGGEQGRGLGDVQRRATLGPRQGSAYLLGGGRLDHRAQSNRAWAGEIPRPTR